MREFEAHGPYAVPVVANGRSRCIDELSLSAWWDEGGRADLATKRGCYVFARRNGRGVLPVYVGMTSAQSFRSECLNARNIKELNKLLASRGTLVLYLIAPAGRGPTGRATIVDLERYLIELAVTRNPDLLNRHGIPHPRWSLKGIAGPPSAGRPSRAASELARVLGM